VLIHVPDDPEEAAAARAAIMADERISYGALGLLLVILDHAPAWGGFSAYDLSRRALPGEEGHRELRDAFLPIADELYEHGYLVRASRKGAKGKHSEGIEAFAVPQESPDVGNPSQVVYVIGQPGQPVAKIGTTSNLRARLRVLQTGSPVRLQVLWSCPGGRRLEAWLHEIYKHWRLEGEWFDFGHSDPALTVASGVASARVMGVR
jgi:hypothetical protein